PSATTNATVILVGSLRSTAIYLINRLPSSINPNKSPYSLLFNKEPDYTTLKPFGCLKGYKCVFLGYSNAHKGYKCVNSHERVFVSRHVVFNENHFPFREYLAQYNEATIKVSNSNQEMFVAAFQNGLKIGHFNESLAQKLATSMHEVMKRAKCYIKGEKSNAEKRSRYAKEKVYDTREVRGPRSRSTSIA
ncbi:hypothetical protein L195_g054500, partial [Trifolium pratense]